MVWCLINSAQEQLYLFTFTFTFTITVYITKHLGKKQILLLVPQFSQKLLKKLPF
jgi:hypothetical protein